MRNRGKNDGSRRYRKLCEEYEDALFRLLMYVVAEKEGELLLQENERLKATGEFQASEEAMSKFKEQLNACLAKRRERRWYRRAIRRVSNLWRKFFESWKQSSD